MKEDSQWPRLPQELEQDIFVLSYRESTDPSNLFLVAKRVYEWLIHLHYEIVISCPREPWPISGPKITESQMLQYGHHVRHLRLSLKSTKWIIPCCPNITDLAYWVPFSDDKDIDDILSLEGVTRLSINVKQFYLIGKVTIWNPAREIRLKMFCGKITHLDVSERVDGWATRELLECFGALTHVAMFEDTVDVKDVTGCLKSGRVLKVLILSSGMLRPRAELEGLEWRDRMFHVHRPGDDERVVRVSFGRSYTKDWKEGASGRWDMWEFADGVLEKRRRKKVRESR